MKSSNNNTVVEMKPAFPTPSKKKSGRQSLLSDYFKGTPRAARKIDKMDESITPERQRKLSNLIDSLNESSQRSSDCKPAALSFDSLSQESNISAATPYASFPVARLMNFMSQDDMDFLTPQDQPVAHVMNPNSPSPLKKRYRPSRFRGECMEDDLVNLTQEMVVLDVKSGGMRNSQPDPDDDEKEEETQQIHHRKTPRIKKKRSNRLPEVNTNPFLGEGEKLHEKRKRTNQPIIPADHMTPSVVNGTMSRFLYDFVELEQIGSGSFSDVFRCMHRVDGCVYAIKKAKRRFRGRADRQNTLREVYALAALSPSAHIVQYYNAWIEDDLLYVQLEHCPQGSIDQIVKKHNLTPASVSEDTLRTIILHITRALEKMHSRGIVHLDIKPSNILLSVDNTFKLGDLGMASAIDGRMDNIEGDTKYLSLEILQGNSSNLPAGDIFALGATIYELALGRELAGNGEEWQSIRAGLLPNLHSYSGALRHLIHGMMHPDVLQRPTASEILEHEAIRVL